MTNFTFEEFDENSRQQWLTDLKESYTRELMGNGLSESEASENARQSLSRTFPNDVPAPGQIAGWAVSQTERVGELWIGPNGDNAQRWWIWWVQVFEELRGQHLGKHLMELCEDLARSKGVTELGLQVLGNDKVARSLYLSVGYNETVVLMRKTLN